MKNILHCCYDKAHSGMWTNPPSHLDWHQCACTEQRQDTQAQLFQMGISISYDSIMEIEYWITTSKCECFIEDVLVISRYLKKGLNTIGTMDNLDHNPSSTTSQLNQFPNLAFLVCLLRVKLIWTNHLLRNHSGIEIHFLPDNTARE